VAAVAVLSSAGAAFWLLDPKPPASPPPLRVVQRLDRPSNVAPFDPVRLATAAGQRWTAAEIERSWTRLGTVASATYRSPAIANPSERLFAIVAALPATRSAQAATLLWSGESVLSREDFTRNRQELRAHDPAGVLVLRGDSVDFDPQPIQHLFLHVPSGVQLGAALDSLSVVRRSDILHNGAIGPLRVTLRGETREVVIAGPGTRPAHEISLASPASLSFGVFAESLSPVRIRIRADSDELLVQDVQPGEWHDFSLPLAGSELRQVGFEAQPETATVYWSTPLVLQPDPVPERPNILLYVVDALRADAIGAYGSAAGRTPAIDALAREGLVFERAYSAASWTKPSVATLFTSLYPMTHGLGARFYSDQLPAAAWTLPQALAANGYATAQFSANPFTGALSNLDRGFDSTMMAPRPVGTASAARGSRRASAIHERLLAWLSARRHQRFFAYVHPVDTHPPFAVGGGTPREGYDASLAALDQEVAALRRNLATLGLDRNTLFVLTADHGEAFGEHGREGHGQSVYDEEVRVPLILRWSAGFPQARMWEPVHHVDLAPTILGAAGIAIPDHLQGRSFWRVGGSPHRSPVVVTRSIYPEDIDSPLTDRSEAIAIVDYPWKLIRSELSDGRHRLELYQLAVDPGERQDQAVAEAARARMLEDALDRFLRDQRAARARFAADHGIAAPPVASRPSRELLDRLKSLGYVR
jgi:arylsulfatase A-like enzyme